jgi:2'-5' RNA ligase
MSKIRAFIAIPLPTQVQTQLGEVSQTWQKELPERSVRWVKPHLMHISLRFLGDTDITTIPDLRATLNKVTAHRPVFTLQLAQTGCFPNKKRPRVIWVGLQGQLDAAQMLKQELDEVLIPFGWEREKRPFKPHLTIGRVKDSRKVKDFDWRADIEPLPIPVRTIHLIESQLRPSGPVYTVRHKSLLLE